MERRQFLGWVGVGTLASYLPIVMAACSPQSETSPKEAESAKFPNEEGFLAVGTRQELAEKGQLSLSNLEYDVMVVESEKKSLSALNPRCTHQGCKVKREGGKNKLACPCHGSEFTLEGKVIKGPAEEALDNYAVKEENGLILVKVA